MIDPHVHCRDGEQRYKETINHVLDLCNQMGIDAVIDMPNTSPPITTKEHVEARLKLVDKKHDGKYYLYIGATADPEQLIRACDVIDEYGEVAGFKLFAGKSVGDLAVIEKEEQRKVYQTLAEIGFKGMVAVHCEKESLLKPELWDPSKPKTHAFARPPESEVASVEDQISLADETGFRGNLHILHVSVAQSISLINKARKTTKFSITCGITPHHLMWSYDKMDCGIEGNLYKMNPPLRSKEEVEKLRHCVKSAEITWFESDHAPHAIGEKLFSPYLSGFPTLYLWPRFLKWCVETLGLSQEMIKKYTDENIRAVFRRCGKTIG